MPGPESEPLRFDMTLPNGEPLRFDMPGARWDGTVAEVMQALQNQTQTRTMLPLSTTLLATEELTTVCTRLSPLWTPLFTTEPLLATVATAADANCAAITASTRQSGSAFTEALRTADAARDAAFTSLRDLAAAAAQNPIATAEQRAAGDRLQAIILRHGNTLHALGCTRQSGKMQALLEELGTAGPTADLALLSLTALFTRLSQAQQEFEEVMADKAAAEGNETLPTVSTHRPLLERRLNFLLAALVEWNLLAPTPALTEALGQIEEVIEIVMTPVLARRTRAENEATPPPAPVEPVV